MPIDALPKLEGQGLVVAAPGPTLRQIRDDCVDAVLCDVLVVADEVVVDRHEGNVDGVDRTLVNRGAAWAVSSDRSPWLITDLAWVAI